MDNDLAKYRAKRDFAKTGEPAGEVGQRSGEVGQGRGDRYVIHKHDATRMHFDFRLELNGVLLSWAVPNGPSLDPKEKRLAVHVEDHPLDYGDFEGAIPKGSYGGGTVMLWDEGTWEAVADADEGMAKGDFKFVLNGARLKGKWALVRIKNNRDKRSKADNWLLIKERDEYSGPEKRPITERATVSVRTGRTMQEIAAGNVEWVAGYHFTASDPAKRKPKAAKERRSQPPKFVAPQLASLAATPPEGDGWLHEIKFDGYRVIAAIGGGRATVYTRTGLDWGDRFHGLIRPLADLPCRSALIDGEAVVTEADGRSDFGALQKALAEGGKPIIYYAFDLIALDGQDLRKRPLVERKRRLAKLLEFEPDAGPLFYCDHVVGHGGQTLRKACDMKLEGIVSKRANGPLPRAAHQELAQDQVRHGPGVRRHRLAAVDREGAAVLIDPGGDAR